MMNNNKKAQRAESEGFEEMDIESGQTSEQHARANMSEEELEGNDISAGMAGEEAARSVEVDNDWKDKYMRLSAEFDNYRKRTLKEKMDLVEMGGEKVITAFLPVLDDIDRALDAMTASADIAAVRTGIQLISQKMKDTLRGHGLSEIDAMGKELDTDFHEAVAKIPAPDEGAKGRIVDVVQKGYELKNKVIRHSKVVVGE